MPTATCSKCGKEFSGSSAWDFWPVCPECKQVELLEKQQKLYQEEAERNRKFQAEEGRKNREHEEEMARHQEMMAEKQRELEAKEAEKNREHIRELAQLQLIDAENQRRYAAEEERKKREHEEEEAEKQRDFERELEREREKEGKKRQILENGKLICRFCGKKYIPVEGIDCYLEYCSKKCACDDLGASNLDSYLAKKQEIIEKHILNNIENYDGGYLTACFNFQRAIYWSSVPDYWPSLTVREKYAKLFLISGFFHFETYYDFHKAHGIEPNDEMIFDLIKEHSHLIASLFAEKNLPEMLPELVDNCKVMSSLLEFANTDNDIANKLLIINNDEKDSDDDIDLFFVGDIDNVIIILSDIISNIKNGEYQLENKTILTRLQERNDELIRKNYISENSFKIISEAISKIKNGEYQLEDKTVLTRLQKRHDELIEEKYIASDSFETISEGISKIKSGEYQLKDKTVLTRLQKRHDELIEEKYIASDSFETISVGISKIKSGEYQLEDKTVLTRLQKRHDKLIEEKYITSDSFETISEAITKIENGDYVLEDMTVLTRLQERRDELIQNLIQEIEAGQENAKTLEDYYEILQKTERLQPLGIEGVDDVLNECKERIIEHYYSKLHIIRKHFSEEPINALPDDIKKTLKGKDLAFASGYNYVTSILDASQENDSLEDSLKSLFLRYIELFGKMFKRFEIPEENIKGVFSYTLGYILGIIPNSFESEVSCTQSFYLTIDNKFNYKIRLISMNQLAQCLYYAFVCMISKYRSNTDDNENLLDNESIILEVRKEIDRYVDIIRELNIGIIKKIDILPNDIINKINTINWGKPKTGEFSDSLPSTALKLACDFAHHLTTILVLNEILAEIPDEVRSVILKKGTCEPNDKVFCVKVFYTQENDGIIANIEESIIEKQKQICQKLIKAHQNRSIVDVLLIDLFLLIIGPLGWIIIAIWESSRAKNRHITKALEYCFLTKEMRDKKYALDKRNQGLLILIISFIIIVVLIFAYGFL